jgi:hypothetical protein
LLPAFRMTLVNSSIQSLFRDRQLRSASISWNSRCVSPHDPFLPCNKLPDFHRQSFRLGAEVDMLLGKDLFKIARGEGKRKGLSIAIFNCKAMFLSTHALHLSRLAVFSASFCAMLLPLTNKWQVLLKGVDLNWKWPWVARG